MKAPAFGIRLWPHSLKGQVLLAIALALLLAQVVGAGLQYRAQYERRESALIHTAAFRLLMSASTERSTGQSIRQRRGAQRQGRGGWRGLPAEWRDQPPRATLQSRDPEKEAQLKRILAEEDLEIVEAIVQRRSATEDPAGFERAVRRFGMAGQARPTEMLVAAVRVPHSPRWLFTRVFVPASESGIVRGLIVQTLLIYALLVGAMALLLRRITRPLAALTERFEHFARSPNANGQVEPEGPEDVRRLILAHNEMEDRITALLDEKDVMLGAIGHDLKTPLAALRVRIESVEDDTERAKMAATVEDIVRTLDDILSLARVGRPSDPIESTELSALVASVVEEYEDMGDDVTLDHSPRIVLGLRATWLRRALRNLIGNALRYGRAARVTLSRDERCAVICIDDDGPGIANKDIGKMLEAFSRGEPSRNTETGGAGLGLALARAIAEQHGGTLRLVNRTGPKGAVEGLRATLRLPLVQAA